MGAGQRRLVQQSQPVQRAKACLDHWSKELQTISFEATLEKKSRASILFSDASATGGEDFLHLEWLPSSQVEADIKKLEDKGPTDWSREAADMFLITGHSRNRRIGVKRPQRSRTRKNRVRRMELSRKDRRGARRSHGRYNSYGI